MALQEGITTASGGAFSVGRTLMGDMEFTCTRSGACFMIEKHDVERFDGLSNCDVIRLFERGIKAGRQQGMKDARDRVVRALNTG